MTEDRLQRVIHKIDEINADDPVKVSINGREVSREIAFADRLEAWVRRLEPHPSEELLIAARGQHVKRWIVPRETFPEGRPGYLSWREELKRMHARTVADVMRSEHYDESVVARARLIVLKHERSANADAQTMEDALCLVFLEFQLADLRSKTPEDRMIDIIRKTWRKMSEKGRSAALALPLPAEHRGWIERAIAAE